MPEPSNEQVEVYADSPNGWIIRTGGRRFPAAVVQGDSLYNLFSKARDLLAGLRNQPTPDANLIDRAEGLVELLGERVTLYEGVLQSYGIELPYVRRD